MELNIVGLVSLTEETRIKQLAIDFMKWLTERYNAENLPIQGITLEAQRSTWVCCLTLDVDNETAGILYETAHVENALQTVLSLTKSVLENDAFTF